MTGVKTAKEGGVQRAPGSRDAYLIGLVYLDSHYIWLKFCDSLKYCKIRVVAYEKFLLLVVYSLGHIGVIRHI